MSRVKPVNQGAQREEVVAQNRFARAHRACRVDRGSDGSHDQDERDHHHHLEQRETLTAIGAARLGPIYETADWCDFHSDPQRGAYIATKSVATCAPPAVSLTPSTQSGSPRCPRRKCVPGRSSGSRTRRPPASDLVLDCLGQIAPLTAESPMYHKTLQ